MDLAEEQGKDILGDIPQAETNSSSGDELQVKTKGEQKTSGETQGSASAGRSNRTGRHPDSGTAAGRSRDLEEVSGALRQLHHPKETRIVLFYPNIATNLMPYVSTQVVRLLIKQPPKLDYKGKYKQRATAMKIVDPEKSLAMSREAPSPKPMWTTSPPTAVRILPSSEGRKATIPQEFFTGMKTEIVRFPPIPSLSATRPATQEADKLDHAKVMSLREELRNIQSTRSRQRADMDYIRARKDFNRFQLDQLNPQIRPVFREALLSYFNTSTGAKRAAIQAAKAM